MSAAPLARCAAIADSKGAAGAVCVRPLDARPDPFVKLAALEQQIDHFGSREVPALDHHGGRLQHGDAARRLAHVGDRS